MKTPQKSRQLAVIVLAAGKGTRMKSDLPKVLQPVAGKPMVWHALNALIPLKPQHTVIVTGHGAAAVEAAVKQDFPKSTCVRQTSQNGTGHAVRSAEKALKGFNGTVLITYGDVPLVESEALKDLLKAHHKAGNAITVGSALVDDPTGLGRILRKDGKLLTIREHKDCKGSEKDVCEINTGLYAVESADLFALLKKVKADNSQQEYYLTDIVPLGLAAGGKVDAHPFAQPAEELCGVNNRVQLAEAETVMQDRLRTQHMLNGVGLADPASVFFCMDTLIGADTTIGPNVVFGPVVKVENAVTIHPFCHIEGTHIKSGASVGPFARLRPGSKLAEDSRIGNFVEVKNSTVGKGSKASHLTYLGDADVGAGVNIGAGTITANYNRKTGKKSRTTIGDGASISADTTLVAPVKVGKEAATGAGTVVREDVPANALAVTKGVVHLKKGYNK